MRGVDCKLYKKIDKYNILYIHSHRNMTINLLKNNLYTYIICLCVYMCMHSIFE